MIANREIYHADGTVTQEQYDDGILPADYLASYAKNKRDGGIILDGVFIATGPEDRSLINGAVTRALLDNDDTKTYPYYPTGGGVVSMTNAQYKVIGAAIANHVQKTLDAEESVNLTGLNTTAQIKAAFDAAYNSN